MYPENHRAWGNLGWCFAYLGNKTEAIKCYEKPSIDPIYELAIESLEWVKGRTERELVAEGMLVIVRP